MVGTLLDQLWFTCRHQFSWPRRSETGEYYQVCLQCGVRYRYDWTTMRRTDRLEHDLRGAEIEAPKRPGRKRGGQSSVRLRTSTPARAKPRWHPRERRLRIDTEILYRTKNGLEWLHGRAENISRSGLLFQAEEPLPLGAAVELVVEMPPEISGADGAKVVCEAMVARVARAADGQRPRVAATILDYTFLPKGEAAGL